MTGQAVDPICGKRVRIGAETLTAECGGEPLFFCSPKCREAFVCDTRKAPDDHLYDLIIVGGGPAGLSAGIYASLTDIDTLFLTKSIGGQAWDSTRVVNYPGFDAIEGPQLVDRFQRQLFDDDGLAHRICEVTRIEKRANTFRVETADEHAFLSRTVLLAMGMRRRRLAIPGEPEFRGKGVLEYHDLLAERYAGQETAVVGGGNSAVQAALGLAKRGARVHLVARSYRADSYLQEAVAQQTGIIVLAGANPLRLEGAARLEELVVSEPTSGAERRLPVQAVFVEIGLVPNSELVRELVIVNERGEVEIDRNCRTGLPGLYAAGDLTNTFGKRILIAAGEGAKAVLAVAEFLRGKGEG